MWSRTSLLSFRIWFFTSCNDRLRISFWCSIFSDCMYWVDTPTASITCWARRKEVGVIFKDCAIFLRLSLLCSLFYRIKVTRGWFLLTLISYWTTRLRFWFDMSSFRLNISTRNIKFWWHLLNISANRCYSHVIPASIRQQAVIKCKCI